MSGTIVGLAGGDAVSSTGGLGKREQSSLREPNGYPRVLLVNVDPLDGPYAAGITLGSLFRGWPKDRIAEIYVDESNASGSASPNSRHLGIEDVRMPQWMRKRVTRQRQVGTARRAEVGIDAVRRGGRFGLGATIQDALKASFLSYASIARHPITSDMDGWIRAFDPDLIYSTLECPHVIALVDEMSRRYSVSAVPHFMDDWVAREEHVSDGILKWAVGARARRQALSVMRSAPVRLVISNAMAVEYKRRYGFVFVPFMNCVETSSPRATSRKGDGGGVFRFAYTGGLHLGRWEVLRRLGEALVGATVPGTDAVIDIYGPDAPIESAASLLKECSIRYRGYVERDKVADVISGYDGLIHVESFERRTMAYTNYSISTKIPEYLASGAAIFACGPRHLASMKYIEAHRCGVVSSHQDPDVLRQELQRFILDKQLRRELGEKARNVAVTYHDACMVREQLREVLATAAWADAREY